MSSEILARIFEPFFLDHEDRLVGIVRGLQSGFRPVPLPGPLVVLSSTSRARLALSTSRTWKPRPLSCFTTISRSLGLRPLSLQSPTVPASMAVPTAAAKQQKEDYNDENSGGIHM
jgi:hypothetical protein